MKYRKWFYVLIALTSIYIATLIFLSSRTGNAMKPVSSIQGSITSNKTSEGIGNTGMALATPEHVKDQQIKAESSKVSPANAAVSPSPPVTPIETRKEGYKSTETPGANLKPPENMTAISEMSPKNGNPAERINTQHDQVPDQIDEKVKSILPMSSDKPSDQINIQPDQIPSPVKEKAESIAKREIALEDYVKIATIMLKKLSMKEMSVLFGQASDDYWVVTPVEDIKKAREMLFSKLSEEDLKTLREIGKKYGRSMEIIKPGIDVAATKAQQVEEYKQKSSGSNSR